MIKTDVLIVGGGPSASCLAMRIDKRFKVLVVEFRQLLDDEHMYEKEKSCGGMLDDAAQRQLAHLGISIPEKVLASPSLFCVRAMDMESGLERTYQRNYLNIRRVEFDQMLLKKAAERENVTVLEGAGVHGYTQKKDKVVVKIRTKEGEQIEAETSYLVGADGAASLIRSLSDAERMKKDRPVMPSQKPKTYVSVQEWYETDQKIDSYLAIFDRKVTNYYAWGIPKDGQLLVGAAMPADNKSAERFEQLKKDLIKKGFDLSRPVKRKGAMILRPTRRSRINDGFGRVFLIGEAAGFISPSSSEGISFALRSGEALARSFHKASYMLSPSKVRSIYKKETLGLKISIFIKTFKSPLMYHPLLRNLIFRSNLTAVDTSRDFEE